ncbi:MAG TPA: PDZ domain-containing protein [Paludibaculum sp.]|jgi:tricorn protease
MSRFVILVVCLFTAATGLSAQAAPPLLARDPALSQTQIVFVFAGDLWIVARSGGEAKRLTAGVGAESAPSFSPDGKWVAFTGQYDGNTDVFVVSAEGGVPRRLTWHPDDDIALGWTPDGRKVLFTSSRNSYSRFQELYLVSLDGGLEERLPLPIAYEGSFSPDSSRIAYVPMRRAFQAWKRYRGGTTTPIWIASLADSKIERVPRDNSNDYCPMWVGDKVYFLSDRNGPVALFVYDTKSKRVTQAAANSGFDFKSAKAGPGGIVVEQFGQLHLFDLKSGKLAPVRVTLNGDMPEVRPKLVNVARRLSSAQISPTGARALFEARGEILTVPAEKGDTRNLTGTPGVMERFPRWSPDGKWISYFSDASGEYELHIKDSLGKGEATKIRLEDKPTFYMAPNWSPDSKKIAYLDAHLQTWYVDIEQKRPVLVDKDRYLGSDRIPVWSPDSKWLAYSKRLENYLGAIFVYSLETAKATQLTDGMSDARHPAFDKDGKYLYFTASTDAGPTMEPDIQSAARTATRSVYLAVLSKSDESPFKPESDEEKTPDKKEDKKDDKKPEAKPEAKPEPKAVEVKIDFDNIGQRILAMPLPPRRYVALRTGKAGILLALEQGLNVHRYDLKLRKGDVVISGVRAFDISADGEKFLSAQAERWSIQPLKPLVAGPAPPTPPPPATPPAAALKTDSIEVATDPRAEWKEMFYDAWRIQREFFYDPKLHGLDLAATIQRYEPFLAGVMARRDLNYVFADMMGEITAGHLGVGGGDQPDVKTVPTGLLGCEYKIENGRYRFARIYDGENWNPDLKAPLTQPGLNVLAGEYLLAVNGRELRAADNVYSFFEATSGKNTLLKVGPNPDGSASRDITVVPVPNESRLRNLAWIEENRRKVDKLSNGRVAYVYMPDTSFGGLTSFNRYFYAQVGKEGVIIDERFNGGGALATDIIEVLSRKRMSAVATRDGADEVQPQGAIFGPKVMIINEFAGSGGDAMPNYFRRANAGKLVGKRTWGGLIGRAGAPQLMDGGFVTAPSSGVWGPDSQWDAENVGIPADVEIEHDPELVRLGRDPQLEKAVEMVLAELARNPVAQPKRPAYPNYHK